MLTMLPEDGEELLQRLSSEMGLPDFMDDVAMDMEPYMPPTMGEDDISDSTSSSETELSPTIRGGCNGIGDVASNYVSSDSSSTDVDAVAADLLCSGVLDQIMVEELSKVDTADFVDQDTKPLCVNNYNQSILNALHNDGKDFYIVLPPTFI